MMIFAMVAWSYPEWVRDNVCFWDDVATRDSDDDSFVEVARIALHHHPRKHFEESVKELTSDEWKLFIKKKKLIYKFTTDNPQLKKLLKF